MTAQENYLPKEPLDLPREPLELPQHMEHQPHEHFPEHHYTQEEHQHQRYDQIRTLLAWQAPGRPFKKRTKEYFISSLLIMLFVEIILFLFSQYVLMLVVLSLVFVSFALATVPPHDFHYRLSTEGITIEDHSYLWQELYDFYFKNEHGIEVLHVRTRALFPGELIVPVGDMHKDHIKSVLLPYLPYREVMKPTFMEKSGDWMAKKFPLERPQKHAI